MKLLMQPEKKLMTDEILADKNKCLQDKGGTPLGTWGTFKFLLGDESICVKFWRLPEGFGVDG